jgi:cytochrome b involved in lipid metabolism
MDYFMKDQENNCVVIFEDVIYNVKEYMSQHPGGPEYLSKNFGKNIDYDFEEAEHTKSARRLFKDLPIVGKMVKGE